ncbi:hypothetical protein C1646_686990, partial [Rhizophagus diaphanus]
VVCIKKCIKIILFTYMYSLVFACICQRSVCSVCSFVFGVCSVQIFIFSNLFISKK